MQLSVIDLSDPIIGCKIECEKFPVSIAWTASSESLDDADNISTPKDNEVKLCLPNTIGNWYWNSSVENDSRPVLVAYIIYTFIFLE